MINPILQITRLPDPIDEKDTFLRSQVDEFFNWIKHILEDGQNTKVNLRHWFNEFSKMKQYHSRKRACIKRTLVTVLKEKPFLNSDIFLEQFQ